MPTTKTEGKDEKIFKCHQKRRCMISCKICDEMSKLLAFGEKDVLFPKGNIPNEFMALIAKEIEPFGGRVFLQISWGEFKKFELKERINMGDAN